MITTKRDVLGTASMALVFFLGCAETPPSPYAPPSEADVDEIDRHLASVGSSSHSQRRAPRPLAASLHDGVERFQRHVDSV